jgi:hypothetical protein
MRQQNETALACLVEYWKALCMHGLSSNRIFNFCKILAGKIFPDVNVLADAESFVCKLYASNGYYNSIQNVISGLFLSLTKTIENLPPTCDALIPRIRQAYYQTVV